MTYSRRNKVEEQQEAAQQAQHIATLCEEFQLTLDSIDWQQLGMQAPVKVNGIEIASLFELGQRERDDLLRLIQIKLLERAALEAVQARPEMKALMWSPVAIAHPQAFLSLWVITLETDERIPIVESVRDGQRVYDFYIFEADSLQQLAKLFGKLYEGAYHLGDTVTIKEHARLFTGVIVYSIAPDKETTVRKSASRGYHTIAGTVYTNDVAAKYIVDCHDGFPHIVNQSQVVPAAAV